MVFRTGLRCKYRRRSFSVALDAKATDRRLALDILRTRRRCQAKWSPTRKPVGRNPEQEPRPRPGLESKDQANLVSADFLLTEQRQAL